MNDAGDVGAGIVPVLDAAAVTKTYRTGVVEVPALLEQMRSRYGQELSELEHPEGR